MTTPFQALRALARHNDPLLAAGIHAALVAAPGIQAVEASDRLSLLDVAIVICDYECGMALAHRQRIRRSTTRHVPGVVVVTWRDREADVRAALQSGVNGYLLSNCSLDELVEAVRAVARGVPYLCKVAAAHLARDLTRTPLTVRESEILRLVANGMSNKMIASELSIALGTVKAHTKAILDKLGARSRTQATVIAAQRGLLGPHSPLQPVTVSGSPSTACLAF